MLAKHQLLSNAWKNILNGGPPGDLGKRIVAKGRNAASVARERERKRTPQQRDPNKGAWVGVVCVLAKDVPLVDAMQLFEYVRGATAIFRKDGYVVEADGYLEGEGEDQVFIAGIRFVHLDRQVK